MSQARKIVIVLPDLRLGGAQRVLLDLSRQFARMGHQVDLISLVGDGALSGETAEGVRYLPLQRVAKKGVWLAVAALPALVRQLLVTRPHAVLSTMTGTNLVAAIAHALAGGPGRLVLREAVSLQNTSTGMTRWLMARVYPSADALIAVSAGVAEDLARVVGRRSRIYTVHNPVDAERIQVAARDAAVSPQRTPYVISIARLTAQKDQATLLRAYAVTALRRTHRLLIVGDGEEREALETLARELQIEDRVVFTGALLNPYPLLAGAALHVLSSRWEGYPNVLLEALELKVPVVATDCPFGPRELLRDGLLGRLAPVGDTVALAAAMDAELRAPMTNDGRQLDGYRPEAVARRYLGVLLGDAREPC